jgi:hypothetical protein
MPKKKPDLTVSFGAMSTIWRLEARTRAGKDWVEQNVAEPPDFMGTRYSFYADHRCGRDIATGAQADGLLVARV